MKAIILSYSFIFFINNFISGSTKSSNLEGHCYSFFMSPLDLGNGNSGFLTTYDGLSRMPYMTSSGAVSGEVKPSVIGSNLYVTDYIATDSLGIYSYGTFNVTLPATDSNSNGVLDFLEKKQSVNAILTFKETTHWDRFGSYTTDEFKVLFLRNANNPNGTYIFQSVNGVDASSLEISGQWYTSSWDATVEYNDLSKKLTLKGTQPDSTGATVNITGQADYSYSEDMLEINNFSLTDGVDTVYSKTIFLVRNQNTYTGDMSLVDGDLDTSWSDYVNWKFFITDFNDEDNDGIPDLTDPSKTNGGLLANNGWSWHKWPWVFNDSLKCWLYYYPLSPGVCSVYNNNDGNWYVWNLNSSSWILSN